MKNLLFIFLLALTTISIYSQEVEFNEYSYSEFFQMIEDHPDSIFTLKNAAIVLDTLTDKDHAMEVVDFLNNDDPLLFREDSIIVDKEIRLENIFFDKDPRERYKYYGLLHNLTFTKKVSFKNCIGLFSNNRFLKEVVVEFTSALDQLYIDYYGRRFWMTLIIQKNTLHDGIRYFSVTGNEGDEIPIQFNLEQNTIWPVKRLNNRMIINIGDDAFVRVTNNKFRGNGKFEFYTRSGGSIKLTNNDFGAFKVILDIASDAIIDDLEVSKNDFNNPVFFNVKKYDQDYVIDFNQFDNGLIYYPAFSNLSYQGELFKDLPWDERVDSIESTRHMIDYLTLYRYKEKDAFNGETRLLGKLYSLYKDQHDSESANAAYIDLKDLETQRLEYLFNQDKSFNTFFTWKVNQFLKEFSAYGTEPARAIVFSVYVILTFAFIYLFFPNSWDSHGKNRIVDRYNFFFKYMRRKAGIHEVYLEDQQDELMSYEQFKANITDSEQKVPKFFTATALPLYKWAISGTKISSALLQSVDVMKGSWEDVPEGKRWWKGVLLVGAFTVAIIYDLMIKMLNALMLSINTFTTLGFGEIPIKGLPRYLAIIEGFIGWFMLTIFSVSLISQLLN